jgi:glutamine amidotransferase
MIAILDYQSGNQTSVRRALEHLGVVCAVTAREDELEQADGLIFPGVGAAGQAMGHLRASGLDRVLQAWVERGRPLLGICLGCQILVESSEEDGGTDCLGLLPGVCRALDPILREEDGRSIRIPHMGWNSLSMRRPSVLLRQVPVAAQFYFVHGYYVSVPDELVLARCRYGLDFCAVYGRDGLWAVQFHPEKSGPAGLRILRNFADYCMGTHAC